MFFTYLDQVLSPGVDLHLTVSKTSTGMVVALLPKINGLNDPAQNKIVPLRISGTPQDLDANFFPSITAPVQKTGGLLVNMKQFEDQADQAVKNSKAVKAAKEAEGKDVKEKKEKHDGFMKKAEKMEAAGNLDGAITNLQQARLHAIEKQIKTVDEKIATLKAQKSQQSLFEVETAQPQPSQTVQSPMQAAPEVQQPPVQQATQTVEQPPVQQMAQAAEQQQQGTPATQPQQQSTQRGIQPNAQGFGMFGGQPMQQAASMQNGYTGQQPACNHSPIDGSPAPEPVFAADGDALNLADYAGIADFQYTHVGEMMSNEQRF